MGWLSSGPDFEGYDPPAPSDENISALKSKLLENMIFFEGGSFLYGNQEAPVTLDGAETKALIYGPEEDPDRAEITIDGFYISAFEITNHDIDLFAAANGLPLRPDRPGMPDRQGPYPAVIPYHMAEGFCEWASGLTGQPVALPTPQQWEYAARSGGHAVAYATQDGGYDYLEELYRATLDGQPHGPHLPNAYPPNPAGVYAMSSNLSEWVRDTWRDPDTGDLLPDGVEGDPAQGHRRGWRGASHVRQAELNSVYVPGAAGPTPSAQWLESFPEDAPLFAPDLDVIYRGPDIGARCVVNVNAPPAESGFGRAAGTVPADFPKPFTPLPRR